MFDYLRNATQALSFWTLKRWLWAFIFTVLIGVALGLVTVLIPNPVFHRDIPPTVWSYPVWVVTSILAGVLTATYVNPSPVPTLTSTSPKNEAARASSDEESPTSSATFSASADSTAEEIGRSSWWGMIGTFGAWFAIGCPVCNKLALVALGYSGAITYFAPLQPWLAAVSLILLVAGVIVRLSGEVACPVRIS